MPEKAKVCFAAHNQSSCDLVGQQLHNFLGQYIEIETWCVNEPLQESVLTSDIFIAGSQPVYARIAGLIPAGKKILIAKRTLDTENLDEVLSLPAGTEALMVSNQEETACEKIKLLQNFAIDQTTLYPYWPGNASYPKHIKVAITTGRHIVPPEIETVIDLGVRTLDLLTFVALIVDLNLPREVINDISDRYVSAIIKLAARRLKVAEQSQKLQRRLAVILGTVDQGIIAIDEEERVTVFNPAAEKMLGLHHQDMLGKPLNEVLPEVENHVKTGSSLTDEITAIGNSHYVVNVTPIIDVSDSISGMVVSLKATREVQELETKVRRELTRKGNVAKHKFSDIAGTSAEIVTAVAMAKKFANTDLTILFEGETGTGKELFAQSVHNASTRRNASFVAVNFAALPESLVESELFGYEEGAFSGARKGGKIGLFEEAHTGTIFLDEIGDASLEVQKRLLRVLEEQEVRRVGSSMVTPINVRVIAATNQNLQQLVAEGKFRQDLYYRLCTIQIEVPPLNKRRRDVPDLSAFLARKMGRRELRFGGTVLDCLMDYGWPGNVRELQNVVKFICGMVGPNEEVTLAHLPAYLSKRPATCEDSVKMTAVEKGAAGKEVAMVVSEFARLGALEPLLGLLSELRQAEMFGRAIGRQAIVQALSERAVPCPEHKVRLWLKRLENVGCVTAGVTKQGTRLTKLGEDVLAFLESKMYNNESAQSPLCRGI